MIGDMKRLIKVILVLLIFYFSIMTGSAQPSEQWNRIFGGDKTDSISSVQQTLDGSYILAGRTNSYGPDFDAWLIKTDENGTEQWNKTFGGIYSDSAISAQQTIDGGYIFVGDTNLTDSWLVKIYPNGTEQWNTTFNGSLIYGIVGDVSKAESVQQTIDGGYILSGNVERYVVKPGYSYNYWYYPWFIKTDEMGDMQWLYNGSFGAAITIQQTSDGGFMAAGLTTPIDGVYSQLLKLSNNGMWQWGPKKFDDTNYSWIDSASKTLDDGFILAGHEVSWTGSAYVPGSNQAWLLKADNNGNKIWRNTFREGYHVDSVQQTSDGGYILTGDQWNNIWLIKTNANGKRQWNITLRGHYNNVMAVQQTIDGDYMLAGNNNSDAFLIKVSKPQKPISTCSEISSPGEYYLIEDIIDSTNSACITITSSDVVFDGNNHLIDGVGLSNTGIYLHNSTVSISNITVKNLELTDWNIGMHLNSSTNNKVMDNKANSINIGIQLSGMSNNNLLMNNILTLTPFGGYGIGIIDSHNNNLTDNIANENIGTGIMLSNSSNNILTDNNASSNADIGIWLVGSSNSNILTNNILTGNGFGSLGNGHAGILIETSSNNILIANTAKNNLRGIALYSSSNNDLRDNNDLDNLFDFYSRSDSINNNVANLNISSIISFKSKDVAIKSSPSPGSYPSGYSSIGKYINATNTSSDSWLFLNVSYSDSDVSGVNENTLRMWRYDGTWSLVSGTNGVDEAQNYVYANITGFSIFAPMAETGIAPLIINITSPANDSVNTTGNINVTVTLNRPGTATLNWEGVNEIMDGAGTSFFKNKTGLLSGTFSFRVYASDPGGNSSVSETRVVTVDRSEPIILPIDPSTGNLSHDVFNTSPSGNTTISIFNNTNISFYDAAGHPVDCGEPNISIDSWDKLPAHVNRSGIDRFAGENLSVEPECSGITDAQIRFIPDALIQFNYNGSQLAALGINEEKLTVKVYNNTTQIWKDANITERNFSANYINVSTSHFSILVLAVPALESVKRGEYVGGDGGGSTGGKGVSSREPADNVERFETSTNYMAKDMPVTYKFDPLEYGIYEIVITGKRSESDMSLRVEHLKGLSRLVKDPAPEIVHYYTNIWGGTEDIKEALFRFREENAWILSSNLKNNGVKMLKWDGSKWNELETKEIKKDSTYTYFEVRSNSLSHLAVIGIKAEPPQVTPTQTVTKEGLTPSPGISPTPTAPAINLYYIGIVLVVLAIILAAILLIPRIISRATMKPFELTGKSPEEYGEKYREHLLEQYKLYVDMADKVHERGQSANNYFLIFNSILVSVFGVLSGIESIAKQYTWQYLLPLAGLLVSITWATLMISYHQLYSGKLNVIHKAESQLPAALYGSEWKITGEGKGRQYLYFTLAEQIVPWIFTGLYIVLIVIATWNR